MFGMGFMEIFLVLIVAIVALGPEKLPSAVVDIAKFFKKLKSGIDDAKSTIDNELNISDMKKEAEDLKATIGDVSNLAKIDIHTENTKPKNTKPKIKKSKKEKISLKAEEV
jgi:sec-independent protein translocase protein TatB